MKAKRPLHAAAITYWTRRYKKILIDKWLILTCFAVLVINNIPSKLVPRADKALI